MSGFNLRDLTVLIVEDNFNFRFLLRNVLQAMGVGRIEEAADGEAAFRLLSTIDCDLIITDWKMTPLDGIEFTRKLRTSDESPNRFVPIIMITGYSEQDKVFEARDAGVNEFLAKPISAKALWTRIAALIERPRPFIRAENYFGPDRRRRQYDYDGPERRKGPSGEGEGRS